VFAGRDLQQQPDVRILSVNWRVSLGALGYLGAFATYDLRERGHSELALALTRAIGDRTSNRVTATVDAGGVSAGAAVSRGLPAGEGAGFHVEAETGDFTRAGAGVARRLEAVTLGLDAERYGEHSQYLGYASGGAVLMGGRLAAVRDIDAGHSFALVEVPSQAAVPIYQDNHRVAVTNAHGVALLSGLRPYELNLLHIDPSDLPIDVALARDEYSVRPYRLGGVRVRFPVAERGGAVVHLALEAPDFVPAGSSVRVGAQLFTVAEQGGVYLPGLTGVIRMEVSWPGHRCSARVSIPASVVLPDLGTTPCEETL
jgi:outer membrane usher protein